MEEIVTRVIPLGARLDESPIKALDAYLTIDSVNGGRNYLQNEEAVAKYGIITKVVHWDDVTIPANLKSRAQAYLNKEVYDNIVLTVTAVDLANMGANVEGLRLLDRVRCVSEPHGLDQLFPITQMVIDLKHPANTKLTLGVSTRMTLTQTTSAMSTAVRTAFEELPTKYAILEEAKANATQLITSGALGSHVVVLPDEIYVMDTDDTSTAKKVWRFNVNGLGFSSNGINGPYGLAMTMDGQIVADRMTTGTLDASKASVINLSASNIKTGTLDATLVKIINLVASNVQLTGQFTSTNGKYSALLWAGLHDIQWNGMRRAAMYSSVEMGDDSKGNIVVYCGAADQNGHRTGDSYRRSTLHPNFAEVGSNGQGVYDGTLYTGDARVYGNLYVNGKFRPRAGQNALYMDWVSVRDTEGNQQWVLAGFREPVE